MFAHSSELDDEVDTVLVELRKKQNKTKQNINKKKKKKREMLLYLKHLELNSN